MKHNPQSLNNYFLIIFLTFNALFSTRLLAQCDPVSDSLTLVAIYTILDGENWPLSNRLHWLEEGQPISNWSSIELNEEGCVDTLNLYRAISGQSIPLEIGDLSNLVYLNLSDNDLTGMIPGQIMNLPNLVYLDLQKNNLEGTIPIEAGALTELTYLILKENNLSGAIPLNVWSLPNLKRLDLSDNNLSGTITIPPEVLSSSQLDNINLSSNQFSGSIPVEIGSINNLNNLWLGNNSFSGTIPDEIWGLSNLTVLDLRENQLSGTISPEVANLSLLKSFSLGSNQFSGTIPSEMGNLFVLDILRLGGNQLTGNIPTELGNLPDLRILLLNNNQLTGTIPIELGSLSKLTALYLDNNQLTGIIPPELGNLGELGFLQLNNNQLTGTIPSDLGNIEILLDLYLNNNQLTGELPPELATLQNTYRLDFSSNQLYGCFPPQYEVFCGRDFNFDNNSGLPNNGDFTLFCENGEGTCDPTIAGQITFDENQNCINDSLEIGLQNWIVKASSVNGDQYSMSDENGYYDIYTNLGEYEVSLILSESPYWEENCTGAVTVNVIDSLGLNNVDFHPNTIADCPFMTVDVSTPFLRRCFSNIYAVSYCNNGTLTAENATIEVMIDDLIIIDSTSIPITEQVGQTLIFELGDIPFNECGAFLIYTNVSCDAELGQTLCTAAHIYPDSICADIAPQWSGATVAVQGYCEGDEVHFEIKNTGDGNMLQERTYVIVEDALILLEAPEVFTLNSEEIMAINLPANGSTYTLQAMQVDNHPIPSMPIAFVEGCGTNDSGSFSTGFVTQFPEDDNAPFMSIDCQEVVGSFDPNDKNGYPKGYAEEHFIEKNQDIEYHIRFQNTGTDTAFTVMVEDVISPNLEMTSLKLGASSHPYKVEFGQNNELKFIFENINLLDSFSNEVASHGFVKFKINQKEDLPIGTQIENTAAIFFDFNEVVITNTTLHTIGEDFVEIVAIEQPFIPNLEVSLAPNPVVNEARIQLSGVEFKNAQLSLYNTIGVLVRQESFNGNEFVLRRGSLPAGIYLFDIVVDGRRGIAGKLVVQ